MSDNVKPLVQRVLSPSAYASLWPEHNREGMERYIEQGITPGDFLLAVLSNDLMGAFGKADPINMVNVQNIALWLYNTAPRSCFGSSENVARWQQLRKTVIAGNGVREASGV